jgi:hypothetical protein
MGILFPKNDWTAFLIIVVYLFTTMAIAGLTNWIWPWENFFYVGVIYAALRFFYVYWPRDGQTGLHSRTLGLCALVLGSVGLVSTGLIFHFHIFALSREDLLADIGGSVIFLCVGIVHVYGAARAKQDATSVR